MKKEDMVKLISAEGFEFVIDKDAAMVSQTIYNMLTSPGHLSLSLYSYRFQLGFHSG
jgi:transcription elongation factor B subunit 1